MRGAISGGEKLAGTRKSDRLPPAGESNGARQVIRVTTMNRVGDREVVRVRPYRPHLRQPDDVDLRDHRQHAAVQRAEAARSRRRRRRAAGRAAGRRARRRSLLRHARSRADCWRAPSSRRRCRPTRSSPACATPRTGPAARGRRAIRSRACTLAASPTLAYAAADREADPYAGFETRIVPENITLLPKTGSQVTGGNSWNERAVTVKKGESIATILRELGATADEISAIAAALGPRGRNGGLKEGQKLRILVAPVPALRACSRSASSSWATARSKRWSRSPIAAATSRSTSPA